MRKAVIVVAGGSGKRMGSELPKQFLSINEKPILMHTLSNLYSFDNDYVNYISLMCHISWLMVVKRGSTP